MWLRTLFYTVLIFVLCVLPAAYKLFVGDHVLDPLHTLSSSGRGWVLEARNNSLMVIDVTQQSEGVFGGSNKVATKNLVIRTIKALKVNV